MLLTLGRVIAALGAGWCLLALTNGAAPHTERDLPYGPDPKQRLDLTLPGGSGFATVVFVHGGSLSSGDKGDADYRGVCSPFPAIGLACASVNYRLAPSHSWPAQALDVAAATAWVRANIPSRGGDPQRLYLFGHSSGATLVALLGADARYLARHDMTPADLRGVMVMGSIMWDDDLEQALARHGRARVEERFRSDPDNAMYSGLDQYLDRWPMRHLKPGLPPYLFLIAEAEQHQPPVLRTNRAFVEQSVAAGNQAGYVVLPGLDHESAIRRLGERGNPGFDAIRSFVGGRRPR